MNSAVTTAKRMQRLFIVLVIAIGVIGGIRFAAQPLRDWAILRSFEPSASIQQLVTDTTMTDEARRVFFINQPEVLDRTEFNQRCQGAGEQTIILGCYHSPQRGIFVFKVTEAELNGIQQVTAAHEMLHAAYDRLSRGDRQEVDAMLQNYYNNDLKDERILRTIELYKKTEPNDLVNEMHSIFGTEVANLPPELESYYTRYFTNRSVVTGFAAQYQQAFTRRQQQIDDYDNQLKQLEAQIKANEAELNRQASALQADRVRVESSRDQEVIDAYNQQVVAYNTLLNQTNQLIDRYNTIVAQRNGIALEQKQLQSSIDSTVPAN